MAQPFRLDRDDAQQVNNLVREERRKGEKDRRVEDAVQEESRTGGIGDEPAQGDEKNRGKYIDIESETVPLGLEPIVDEEHE